ncbi:hypothetical protein B7494_g3884 [Chlorociboria aeruginascens]|nr:hypothetical protein B7494_g3884 [Chlorociboria aeruginascens]
MSTDTEKLLLAVVSQLEINKLDYDRLARDIGILSSEAARLRWFRLKSKLKQSAATTPNTGPSKPSGVQKTKSTPRTRKMGAHIKSESGRDEPVNPVTPPLKRLPSKRARAKQIIEISDSDIDEGLMEDMQKAEKKERCDGGWEELRKDKDKDFRS